MGRHGRVARGYTSRRGTEALLVVPGPLIVLRRIIVL